MVIEEQEVTVVTRVQRFPPINRDANAKPEMNVTRQDQKPVEQIEAYEQSVGMQDRTHSDDPALTESKRNNGAAMEVDS